MLFCVKCLITVLALTLSAIADSYNIDLINIHAKVFPKILLIDTKIDEKLVNGSIKVIILYSEKDVEAAETLKKESLRLYPILKEYPLQIALQEYKDFNPEEPATAYYELLGEQESVTHINTLAQKNSRITFSYDNSYLEYGTLMSLYISSKVTPYINIEALKQSNIELDNIIFKIARIK